MIEAKLAAELNVMHEWTVDQIESVVRARNAAIEKRLAGVLLSVMLSDLSISTPVAEMVMSLTLPEWDRPDGDPTQTPLGRKIVQVVRSGQPAPPSPATPVGARLATKLWRLAESPSAVPDEATDFMLRAMTGRDGMWWVEWIREQRGL